MNHTEAAHTTPGEQRQRMVLELRKEITESASYAGPSHCRQVLCESELHQRGNMSFIVTLDSLDLISAESALQLVLGATKKRLEDLTVFDLIFEETGLPIDPPQGLYFFFDTQGYPLYVGKNSSMSFVERVPWHFALSDSSWQNHFLKHLRRRRTLNSLADTAGFARDCGLVLLPVRDHSGETIAPLEKFFRLSLRPVLNKYSDQYNQRNGEIDLTLPLTAVINSLATAPNKARQKRRATR